MNNKNQKSYLFRSVNEFNPKSMIIEKSTNEKNWQENSIWMIRSMSRKVYPLALVIVMRDWVCLAHNRKICLTPSYRLVVSKLFRAGLSVKILQTAIDKNFNETNRNFGWISNWKKRPKLILKEHNPKRIFRQRC